MKIGDVQGYYVGGGFELAAETNDELKTNRGAGGLGAYAKIEGLKLPEAAILMAFKGKNDMVSPAAKIESFYFAIPWATDKTTIRPPNLPDANPHSPKSRKQALSSDEVLKLIKETQSELKTGW